MQPPNSKLIRLLTLVFFLVGCGAAATNLPTNVPTHIPTNVSTIAPAIAPANTPTAIPARPTLGPTLTATPALSQALDALMSERVNTDGFTGSVLVARNSQILLNKGYGLANVSAKLANTPQTRFVLGSITKQFTAMAILMLETKGKLTVETSICTYIADCPMPWKPITLHELLDHTSGIPDYAGLDSFTAIEGTPAPLTQTLLLFRDLPLDFTPGAQFEYSSSNYFLLGLVVEKVSGQSYGDFLRQYIFDALGMTNSGYGLRPASLAVGYLDGGLPAGLMDPTVGFSAGSMYATTDDLYRWDRALDTDTLIPSSVLGQMFTAQVITNDPTLSYGYGWFITSDKGHRLYFHTGINPGFHNEIARYVDDHLVIIVLSNQESGDPDTVRQLLADKVLGQ